MKKNLTAHVGQTYTEDKVDKVFLFPEVHIFEGFRMRQEENLRVALLVC